MATLNIKNMDDALYAKLKERAERQHRSVAQEITHILTATLSAPPALSILDLEGLGAELWKDRDAAEHVSEERDAWG